MRLNLSMEAEKQYSHNWALFWGQVKWIPDNIFQSLADATIPGGQNLL